MLSAFSKKNKKKTISLIVILIISLITLIFNKCEENRQEKERSRLFDGKYSIMHYLDAGQGDCTLIETHDGKFALIDSSTNDASDKIVDYLEDRGVKELEFILFTHPHEDHIGSGDEVIENFKVKTVYMNDKTQNTSSYQNLISAIKASKKKHGTRVIKPEKGMTFTLSDMVFTVISDGKKYDDINNSSICIKAELGKSSFLFTGDAEKEVENDILKSGANIDSDVFKCGHHGSSTSNSSAFLDEVSPGICIISCGIDNDYGHPHVEVVEALEERQIKYFRTDLDGDILIAFNESTLAIL